MKKLLKQSILPLFLIIFLGLATQHAVAGLKIVPAKIETVVTKDNHVFPILIENSGTSPLRIKVYATKLKQKLDGSPHFDESKEGLKFGAELFKFNLTDFDLMAGKSQTVKVDVQIPRKPTGGVYATVFFQATDATGDTQNISSIIRIASLMLLTFPDTTTIKQGEHVGVEFLQAGPNKPIKVLSTFRNNGNIHFAPTGSVTITDETKKQLAIIPIDSANVLPGFARQLKAMWTPANLSPGTYTATSELIIEGAKPMVSSATFSAINLNVIAQRKGEVVSFSAPRAVMHKPINFELLFHNSGNVDLAPIGNVEVKDAEGKVVAQLPIETTSIGPDDNGTLKASLKEGLPIGDYTAVVTAKYDAKKQISAEAQFTVIEMEPIVQVEIDEITVLPVKVGQPVMPKMLFKNSGNVKITPQGIIELKTAQGKSVGQIPVEALEIAPGKTETLTKSWKGNLPTGLYKAVVTLIYGEGKSAMAETMFLVTK